MSKLSFLLLLMAACTWSACGSTALWVADPQAETGSDAGSTPDSGDTQNMPQLDAGVPDTKPALDAGACAFGFEIVNGECRDVDECAVANGSCDEICVNVDGGRRCECGLGHQRVDETTCSTSWYEEILIGNLELGNVRKFDVASNRRGDVVVVWVDGLKDDDALRMRVYSPERGWGPIFEGVQLATGTFSELHVGIDDTGNGLLLWLAEYSSTQFLVGSRWNAGDGFGSASIVSESFTYGVRFPQLNVSPAGDAIVTWIEARDDDHDVRASKLGVSDTTWGAETTLDQPLGDPTHSFALASNRHGQLLVAWGDSLAGGGMAQMWSATYDGTGAWSSAVRVIITSEDDAVYGASVALGDDARGLIGMYAFFGDRLAQYVQPIGFDDAPQVPVLVSTGDGFTEAPDVVVNRWGDGLSNARSSDEPATQVNVREYLRDSGWSYANTIGEVSSEYASEPKLVMNADGNAYAYWLSNPSGRWRDVDIMLARYHSYAGFGAPTIVVDTDGEELEQHELVMFGDSDAALVFLRSDGGYLKLYAKLLPFEER